MKPGVFITFDVECSMGGAWGDPALEPVPPARGMMGAYGKRRLGVPLITDILRRHDLAATFFVEPFNDELGHPGETEPVVAHLLERGQDVQLHVHPGHKHYGLHRAGRPHPGTDDLADLAPEAQRALVEEGAERLAGWTGRRPTAFRAGNMAASEATLAELAAAGILVDSSYTFPYAGGQCRFSPEAAYNGSRWYGEVLELALSGFRQPRFPGLHRAKPLDLVGISFAECRDGLRRICDAGADAVLILHSFSLFKVRSWQYDGGRLDRIVAGRFRRLCGWLAAQRDAYPAWTFAELAKEVRAGRYEAREVPPFTAGVGRALVRKAVQLWNRPYWT